MPQFERDFHLQPAQLDIYSEQGHEFSVLTYECTQPIEDDQFFLHMVQLARDVYGEYLLNELPEVDPAVEDSFDLSAITKAVRSSLPDPEDEEKKPANLRNYRSEAAELVARKALGDSFGFIFPAAAQVTKGNASQPILGFDGWGMIELEENSWAFVVIQVKGSDDSNSPPGVVDELISECKRAPNEPSKLTRALVSILALVRDEKIRTIVLRMLERLGQNKPLKLIVAPVIVRGKVGSNLSDISSLKDEIDATDSSHLNAASASIGIDLNTFGKSLFEKAGSDD